MARFYADENFEYPVVRELRLLGHDVLTAQEAGQAHQRIPDPLILAFADSLGRAVLTFNRRHFIRLHASTASHCGIIVCTRDQDRAALAMRIHHSVGVLASLDNQLLRIIRPSTP